MHLESLKVFCDVAGLRSFSRAADENGMSQSGASQAVHQIEDRLGVKLIDRSKRPFVLTPAGQLYYKNCRRLLDRYFALEEEVKSHQDKVAGHVHVASIYSIGLSHMNQFVKGFIADYPQSNVQIEYQHPHRVTQLVENDQVDLGLVSYPASTRSIEAIPWREEPMVVVCAQDHRFSQYSSIALAELDGIDFVGFDEGLQIRRSIDRALAESCVGVNVVMQFDNIETIKRATETGAGITVLPEPTVDREIRLGSLVAIPLSDKPMVRPLGVIHRRGKEQNRTARRFIDMLLEQVRPTVVINHDNTNGKPVPSAAVQ